VIDEEYWLDAWGAGDERVLGLCTDDVEVVATAMSIKPRYYRGPAGAKQWLDDLRVRFKGSWTNKRLTRIDQDALIIGGTMQFAEPNPTGSLEQDFAVLMRLRDDKACWIGTFVTFEEAEETWQRGITDPGAG